MITPERPQSFRQQAPKKSAALPAVLLVFCLVLAAGGWYFFSRYQILPRPDIQQASSTSQSASTAEQKAPASVQASGPFGGVVTPDAPTAEDQAAAPESPGPSTVGLLDDSGTTQEGRGGLQNAASGPVTDCSEAVRRLQAFFTHLEGREYIQQAGIGQTVQAILIAQADKLLDSPPVVSRETDDLVTLMRNTAHIFRVAGKSETLLLREIMNQEKGQLEEVAASLFFLIQQGNCGEENLPWRPRFEPIYDYAVFFLNTMGGRAYMFRRDSLIRLLTTYYAIRLVDIANTAGENRHGLNLAPLLPQLIREMETTSVLSNREHYLDTLLDLREKYQ